MSLLAVSCIIISCQKENSVQEVEDVCTKMQDINFMEYCYDSFDANHDGKVSMQEAAAVKTINCTNRSITSLQGLEYFSSITELSCDSNHLTSLDVSRNTSLLYLFCLDNKITSLKVSKNTALNSIWCSGNMLTSLDVSKNTELTQLLCDGNNLTTLDVSNNKKLRTFIYNPQKGDRTITPTGWNK